MVLTQLEQGTVYNSINFSLAPSLPDMGANTLGAAILPALNVPQNSTAVATRIAVLNCPSDHSQSNWGARTATS